MNEYKGILDLVEYQNVESEIKQYYLELASVTKEIEGEFEQIFSNMTNCDLSYLVSSYKNQIDELNKIDAKMENYYSVLSNVRIGYQNQANEISQNINLYLNKIKEEI